MLFAQGLLSLQDASHDHSLPQILVVGCLSSLISVGLVIHNRRTPFFFPSGIMELPEADLSPRYPKANAREEATCSCQTALESI